MSRHLRITSLLRRLQLLLMGHGRHVSWSRVVGRWMVVFFTFLFHLSSWTQARCNKEFWIGTNRHSRMHYVGRLVSFAYVSAGFAIEMDVYAKFKLPRC